MRGKAALLVIVLAGCSASPGDTTREGPSATGTQPSSTAAAATFQSATTTTSTEATSTEATSTTRTVPTRPEPPPRLRREVEVRRGPRSALYTLPADLLFDTGETELRPGSAVIIGEVAHDISERFRGRPIIVRGHTDSVGGSRANRELSRLRAETVAGILYQQGGLESITIEAFGELDPRASNDTVKLRRRRIEPLAQLFDFVNGTCLERALRLHFRRDVYKPNGKTSRHFLPSRGEEGLHGWLTRRNPKDAKTLHGPQANILRVPLGAP